MTAYSGYTASTPLHLVLDAGAVYLNYGDVANERLLGATTDGNELEITRDVKPIQVDGVKGTAKGLTRLIKEEAKLTVNLKEITAENLKVALAGASIDSTTDLEYDIITSNGDIKLSDYIDNVTLVAQVSGSDKPIIITLFNGLSTEGLKFTTKDTEEVVIPITFMSHYDPADLSKSPYEIKFPKIA